MKKHLLLFASLLFFTPLFAQYNWGQETSNTTEGLQCVFFVNSNLGFAAGSNGTLVRYTNGSWEVLESGTDKHIQCIFFLNENVGWIGAQGGVVMKTTDGGDTWTAQTTNFASQMTALAFVSENDGWASGSYSFLRIDETGWKLLGAQGDYNFIQDIDMLSSSLGFAVGQASSPHPEKIYKYNGTTWVPETDNISSPFVQLRAVSMVSATEGWLCGASGTIAKYNGSSWNVQSVPLAGTSLLSGIHFSASDKGWVVGTGGMILHYNGSSWIQDISNTTNFLWDIHCTGEDCWAVGNGGTILHKGALSGVTKKQDTKEMISLYPNPANDRVTIKNKNNKELRYSMNSAGGVMVEQGMLEAGSSTGISIDHLNSGVYYIFFESDEMVQVEKVIKY